MTTPTAQNTHTTATERDGARAHIQILHIKIIFGTSHKTVRVGATALEHRGAFEDHGRSSYWMDEPKTNAQTSKDSARNMVYQMSELLKCFFYFITVLILKY